MSGTELAVPMEAVDALESADLTYTDTTPEAEVRAVARPVVVAELLALADKVAALPSPTEMRDGHGPAVGDVTYIDGYDRAVGDVRDLIADRLAELGVKVEEL